MCSPHTPKKNDLQEVTQDVHYENYRSERLAARQGAEEETNSLADADLLLKVSTT